MLNLQIAGTAYRLVVRQVELKILVTVLAAKYKLHQPLI